ncbi:MULTISPECIES: helix-turn-helix domain-containing protein [unclassified Streptomyces]|uniref:helix-turn-helix domain-containing protein n=1 Tax=unclassified Streptomyces TaxID=2593676 RepID=UPI0036E6CF8F
MSTLSAQQRGDLVQAMLPVAANLAVLVHGDGGPEDIADVLAGLDDTAKNALIVVLAGMVDPEQPVGRRLSWTAVTRNAALPMPAWLEQKPIREHVVEVAEEVGEDFVDEVAVSHFVQGLRPQVTDAEFVEAVRRCAERGVSLSDVDRMQGWPEKTAENRVNRIRKRYQRSGRVFPSLALNRGPNFTEQMVIRIRERAYAGTSCIELALKYGTTRETIRRIATGVRYPEYGGPIRAGRTEGTAKASREYMCGHADGSQAASSVSFQPSPAVLTPQQRDEVRQRAEQGEAVRRLADEYGVSARTIRRYAAA